MELIFNGFFGFIIVTFDKISYILFCCTGIKYAVFTCFRCFRDCLFFLPF